jgi:hypothetical protein
MTGRRTSGLVPLVRMLQLLRLVTRCFILSRGINGKREKHTFSCGVRTFPWPVVCSGAALLCAMSQQLPCLRLCLTLVGCIPSCASVAVPVPVLNVSESSIMCASRKEMTLAMSVYAFGHTFDTGADSKLSDRVIFIVTILIIQQLMHVGHIYTAAWLSSHCAVPSRPISSSVQGSALNCE